MFLELMVTVSCDGLEARYGSRYIFIGTQVSSVNDVRMTLSEKMFSVLGSVCVISIILVLFLGLLVYSGSG